MNTGEKPAGEATPAPEELPVPAATGSSSSGSSGSSGGGNPRSFTGSLAALIGVLASLAYILNPGFGFFELLPDNLPGIGNLDEAGATTLLILGLRYLFRRPSKGP